jgi:signal transduction histidine kinase
MRLLDLSVRVKLPLLGALLIVISALGVSSTLMIAAYAALREDFRINSEVLGRSLAPGLLQAMLHDDTWHAFETVRAPTKKSPDAVPVKAETLLVVDRALNVFVSAHPRGAPVLAPLRSLGPDYAALADRLAEGPVDQTTDADRDDTRTIDLPGSDYLYVLTPIADDHVRFGTLIIVVDKNYFLPRFQRIAGYGLLAGLLVLALLLPINWYWGRRMALPLTQLTERMGEIGQRLPASLDPGLYDYGDELGRLFAVYNQMLAELKTKAEMERQIVQSERLAALGQLAAGIAHEINNPLGGMLTAIDTLKCHTEIDAQTKKTIDLIERGLFQIKDTVGALLVEARLKSRNLTPKDIDDVLTLVMPQAHKKNLHVDMRNALAEEVQLPATLVRQILINLLLNAVEAALPQGSVDCAIDVAEGWLHLRVANTGSIPTEEQITHLFDPFFSLRDSGHGLGLWVTYQIVNQLGGRIGASKEGEQMQFAVAIPVAIPFTSPVEVAA